MSLKESMTLVHRILSGAGAPHALIGGMALSALGNPSATNDVDFLVHSDFRIACEAGMISAGFKLIHSTVEVAQWDGNSPVEFLYANREISRLMLSMPPQYLILGIPVLDPSDIVGLKIQAYINNPKRLFQDFADVQKTIENNDIDWKRVEELQRHFANGNELPNLESKESRPLKLPKLDEEKYFQYLDEYWSLFKEKKPRVRIEIPNRKF